MTAILAVWPLIKKFGPWVLLALALLGIILWIHGMQSTIADQKTQIGTLQTNLQAETLARTKDVAGLTTLAQGTAAAAIVTQRDAQILTETVDAKNPAPASPGLSAFLGKLREADSAAAVQHAAASTGDPTTK